MPLPKDPKKPKPPVKEDSKKDGPPPKGKEVGRVTFTTYETSEEPGFATDVAVELEHMQEGLDPDWYCNSMLVGVTEVIGKRLFQQKEYPVMRPLGFMMQLSVEGFMARMELDNLKLKQKPERKEEISDGSPLPHTNIHGKNGKPPKSGTSGH